MLAATNFTGQKLYMYNYDRNSTRYTSPTVKACRHVQLSSTTAQHTRTNIHISYSDKRNDVQIALLQSVELDCCSRAWSYFRERCLHCLNAAAVKLQL
jgi:hypothetical protein